MSHTTSDLAGIILAGGASSRMGHDKRRLRLWGEAGPLLLEYMLNLLTPHCNEQIVVLNDPLSWADLPARLVLDQVLDAGPLGGLAAGLAAIHAERALVVACDMPLVRGELLDALAAYPTEYDAIVPLHTRSSESGVGTQRAIEPLLAVYHRRCLPIMETCLNQGERRMTALLDQLYVRYVDPSEWHHHDPEGRSFLNLNHPTDVQAIRAAE